MKAADWSIPSYKFVYCHGTQCLTSEIYETLAIITKVSYYYAYHKYSSGGPIQNFAQLISPI
jgi:hypothetical protein